MLVVPMLGGCDRQSGAPAQQAASSSSPSNGPDASGFDRSHKGSQLPDLTFKDASGKSIRLVTLTGKPVLINLWATWCAPCIAELPGLNALAAKGEVKVVTISQDTASSAAKVAPFLKAKGGDALEPWLDGEGEAAKQYNVMNLPTTIYYNAQGREVWRLTGPHDWAGADTASLLSEGK